MFSRGMRYLYSQGVEHRDLKCANCLLTTEGRVKVVDFGLARCEELLHGGEGVDAVDEEGHTALHLACDRGHLEIARSLLQRGAPLEAQNCDGMTALHMACACEHLEGVGGENRPAERAAAVRRHRRRGGWIPRRRPPTWRRPRSPCP